MCGLGSITFTSDFKVDAKKLDEAVSALLVALNPRGRDACGYMTINAEGEVFVEKAPADAKDFNAGRQKVQGDTRAVAVHTRMATKGKEWWNRNNHPVAGPNGALVCHNGVVADGWLERKSGQPEVDTFAIAMQAGGGRKKQPNQRWMTYAERVVRQCAELEGSMTLQLAFRGMPLLISAKVATNPLYCAESEDGNVRVSASTYEAVKRGFEALGVKIPEQATEYTTHGKKGSKTQIGVQPLIYQLNDGDLLVWAAGKHDESHIALAAPTRMKYARTSYTAPRPASDNDSKPWYQGSTTKAKLVKPEFTVGEWIETNYGRTCTVKGVQETPTTRHYVVQVHAYMAPNKKRISEYEATLGEHMLRPLVHPPSKTTQDIVRSLNEAEAREAAEKARLARIALAANPTQQALPTRSADADAAAGSSDGSDWDRCELCNEWSNYVTIEDDVSLCATCLSQVTYDTKLFRNA